MQYTTFFEIKAAKFCNILSRKNGIRTHDNYKEAVLV